jgi:large-conductance mechanosensitive channel
MFSKFVKFEVGILIGTLFGAVIASLICTIAFNVLGYDNENLFLIQECLERKLAE